MRRLTPAARQQLVQRIMATATRAELHALERKIAEVYAATLTQRTMNAVELEWLRTVALARREMVGRA